MRTLLLFIVLAACSPAQDRPDKPLEEAGVCARCHVISVVEWGYSGHRKAGTGCVACHGVSDGHVIDERNNIKPERMPRGEALAALCTSCHGGGCPKTSRKATCATCHHFHALVDVKRSIAPKDERLEALILRWKRYEDRMAEGVKLAKSGDWHAAGTAFRAALLEKPGDEKAAARLDLCERRLRPGLPGFESAGTEVDEATGLPRRVKVAGLGTAMVLVNGGDFEIGSETFASSKPVHSVTMRPFYLATHEVTQKEFKAVMGTNPSRYQGKNFPDADNMPVESVSWDDVRAFLDKLNSQAPGAGFRLPTEAEWEIAALPGGEAGEAFDLAAPRTVGKGTPNRFGLFDIQGNVREWCSSIAAAYPYDDADGREAVGGTSLRAVRGGAFAEPESWYDPAMRHSERPSRRLSLNGFRLARSVPSAPAAP